MSAEEYKLLSAKNTPSSKEEKEEENVEKVRGGDAVLSKKNGKKDNSSSSTVNQGGEINNWRPLRWLIDAHSVMLSTGDVQHLKRIEKELSTEYASMRCYIMAVLRCEGIDTVQQRYASSVLLNTSSSIEVAFGDPDGKPLWEWILFAFRIAVKEKWFAEKCPNLNTVQATQALRNLVPYSTFQAYMDGFE